MSDQAAGNKSYAGQRSAASGAGPYNTMAKVIEALVGGMATATLAQVKAVHPGGELSQGTVDVQLLVDQIDSIGNATPHGIVFGLPYARVQAGTNALIIDPEVGDIGVVVFASRDISSVIVNAAKLAAGKVTSANPGSFRRFDYADGLYLFSGLGTAQPANYIRVTDALIKMSAPSVTTTGNLVAGTGDTGTFQSADGKTVTVMNGIITSGLS